MTTYFTSDLHIGHTNVLKFDSRPFSSVEEMNEELIKRWNKKVKSGDIVYCLGDMFWKGNCEFVQNTLNRLNGQVILIKGNHDRWLHNSGNKKLLAAVKDYDDIKVTLQNGEVKRCVLSHYPIHFYNGHYHNTIMLYGHVHNTHEYQLVKQYAKWLNENECPVEMYNVGTMLWNYEPVTLDEILEVDKT